MKKFVLKLDLEAEDKEKQRRALKTVAALSGIDEITVDAKGKTVTVIGTVDPVTVVSKLRKKSWQAVIVSVGPAKEPEPEAKKEEPQKEGEGKKDEPAGKDEAKKDEAGKEEPKKEEGDQKKKDEPNDRKAELAELVVGTAMPYRPYYPPPSTYYYAHHSVEENPTGCTIS